MGYQIYATIISFYLPTLIMIILNVKIWRAAKRLARQDRVMSGSAGAEVDRNGNEHSDLITEKESPNSPNASNGRRNSSKFFKSEAHKYIHRPSSFLQAVKLPLIRNNEKNECKARKTLGVIMSAFIITWLPFFSLAILKSCFGVPVPPCTLNPMIYCKYNKDYRMPFREMISCRCRTLQTVMRQHSFKSRYGPTV
ncbi:hypothetical protein WR25_22218 [Diploscapter pachys]|uniref:G-protein coupled receptors family 1 profile domain-containing protein n=1 Tax=Diploscapter pachys TaxID=2018661 RepID=A0A2A2KS13_9BILA|nr:hypothetical protein WR25_22218 [Diploscapter pachys]